MIDGPGVRPGSFILKISSYHIMNSLHIALRALLGLVFFGLVGYCWLNDKSFTTFIHVYAALGIGIAKARACSFSWLRR